MAKDNNKKDGLKMITIMALLGALIVYGFNSIATLQNGSMPTWFTFFDAIITFFLFGISFFIASKIFKSTFGLNFQSLVSVFFVTILGTLKMYPRYSWAGVFWSYLPNFLIFYLAVGIMIILIKYFILSRIKWINK